MIIEVRPLEEAEFEVVVRALPSRPEATHRRRLERQRHGTTAYLIGWLDGRPAGFVQFGSPEGRDVDDLLEFRGHPFVHDLNVEAPLRRRGVARALMLEVERRARADGAAAIGLTTGTDDYFAAARALYRELGYENVGGVFIGGWSDPEQPGVHFADPLTRWIKRL
jgi:ribosomal protein S18 acetylase RimI-like enzyme